MKKIMIALTFVALLFSMLPVSATAAAPLLGQKPCSISSWNTKAGINGGCTCYVAVRVKNVTGKLIPWGGNAGAWWSNSSGKWTRSSDQPRKGAIAAFSYGHVSYVDSVVLKSTSQPVKVKTQPYSTYFLGIIKVTATATLYKVTETYTVNASQKDYGQSNEVVRLSSWQATRERYYWASDPRSYYYWSTTLVPPLPQDKWTTPRGSGSNGLQGYIYP